jgi:hypothetical protein
MMLDERDRERADLSHKLGTSPSTVRNCFFILVLVTTETAKVTGSDCSQGRQVRWYKLG